MKQTVRIGRLVPAVVLAILAAASTASADWQPAVRITNEPGESEALSNGGRCICASGDAVNVVWTDNRSGNDDIYVRRSQDGGASWVSELCLSAHEWEVRNPAVAAEGLSFHVVWADLRNDYQEIYHRRSLDGGATWENDNRLTTIDAGSCNPIVAVSNSVVHVVWQDDRDQTGNDITYYKRSADNGASWSPDVRLDDADESTVPVVAAADTLVYVVWNGLHDIYPVCYYRRSTDGGATWGERRRVSDVYSIQLFPSVSAHGECVDIAWNDSRVGFSVILHKRSTDGGATWGPDNRVSVGEGYSSLLTVAGIGSNVHVAWNDAETGNSTVLYQRSIDGGATWYPADEDLGDPATNQWGPSLAVAGTAVHVAWTDDRDADLEVYYRRDPTGSGVVERDLFGRRLSPLAVSPGPFVTFCRIAGRAGEQFDVYDLAGKLAGSYRGDRVGDDLRPGVYFIRDAAGTAEARIVKVR